MCRYFYAMHTCLLLMILPVMPLTIFILSCRTLRCRRATLQHPKVGRFLKMKIPMRTSMTMRNQATSRQRLVKSGRRRMKMPMKMPLYSLAGEGVPIPRRTQRLRVLRLGAEGAMPTKGQQRTWILNLWLPRSGRSSSSSLTRTSPCK